MSKAQVVIPIHTRLRAQVDTVGTGRGRGGGHTNNDQAKRRGTQTNIASAHVWLNSCV